VFSADQPKTQRGTDNNRHDGHSLVRKVQFQVVVKGVLVSVNRRRWRGQSDLKCAWCVIIFFQIDSIQKKPIARFAAITMRRNLNVAGKRRAFWEIDLVNQPRTSLCTINLIIKILSKNSPMKIDGI